MDSMISIFLVIFFCPVSFLFHWYIEILKKPFIKPYVEVDLAVIQIKVLRFDLNTPPKHLYLQYGYLSYQ